MAISINDRQLITQFITNTQNLNVNLPTNGGGCANLVRGIIEQATGKRISVNPFGASLESMIQKIKAIIYYFTQQNKSATAVIVVVVTNILI